MLHTILKYVFIAALLILSTTSLFAQSESEPNDGFGTADVIGLTNQVTGFIGESGDQDYFSFTIPSPGIIDFSLNAVPSDIRLAAYIYNSSSQQIAADVAFSVGQGINMQVSTCEAGTYYIRIERNFGASFNENQPYSFTINHTPFAGLDDCECNDSGFSQACPIGLNELTSGIIAPVFGATNTADQDFFSFTILSPGIIDFSLNAVPSDIRLAAYIYNSSSQQIAADVAFSIGQGINMQVSTCEAGTYYIRIERNFGASFNENQPYSFTVNHTPFAGLDDCECNDSGFSQACPIGLNELTSGIIAPVFGAANTADQDFFSFTIPSPGIIDFSLNAVPSDIRLAAYIYNSSSQQIAADVAFSVGQGINMQVSTCEAGTYYIRIERNFGASFNENQPYSFTVNHTPFATIDNCECNNSLQTACPVAICEQINAGISPPFTTNSDRDFFSFEGVAGLGVDISLFNGAAELRPRINVYNTNGISVDNASGSTGQGINFNFSPVSDGTHFVEVVQISGSAAINLPYTLSIGCNLVNTDEWAPTTDLQLSPNPAREEFSLSPDLEPGTLTIFTMIGQKVQSEEITNCRINIQKLIPGQYYCVYQGKSGTMYRASFVKQ